MAGISGSRTGLISQGIGQGRGNAGPEIEPRNSLVRGSRSPTGVELAINFLR